MAIIVNPVVSRVTPVTERTSESNFALACTTSFCFSSIWGTKTLQTPIVSIQVVTWQTLATGWTCMPSGTVLTAGPHKTRQTLTNAIGLSGFGASGGAIPLNTSRSNLVVAQMAIFTLVPKMTGMTFSTPTSCITGVALTGAIAFSFLCVTRIAITHCTID